MSPIKSTYNFVPAPNENEVVKPDWADQVSHDIPFSDGESGEISIKITSKTPIFIRNGHTKKDAEDKNDNYLSFSHRMINGKKEYFIPGSSLKGMIRNVLEIMSFSRMKQIDNHRYAFRNLTKDSLYRELYNSDNVECGWLRQNEDGKWMIENCGKPIKVTHQEIDDEFKTSFRKTFKYEKYSNFEKFKENKYVFEFDLDGKHYKLPTKSFKHKNNVITKKHPSKYKLAKVKLQELERKTNSFYNIMKKNGVKGTLVFTGQSSLRNDDKETGKNNEFLFPDATIGTIDITDNQQKDFKFIYYDHDKNNISKDWEFWRDKKLNENEKIPIFFSREDELATTVLHFGLAFMYKLPYKNSTHETFPYKDYNLKEPDLAELIFGYTSDDNSLKGRVMVSPAFSKNAEPENPRKEILASPKASYYPFYLNQNNLPQKYDTYMDDVELRGYKRYPVQKEITKTEYTDQQLRNSKVFSHFIPLKKESLFEGKIRFHNLKKVEIGALLSALTFHGNNNHLFHSLGGYKSLGFGKVKLDIQFENIDSYLLAFEKWLKKEKQDLVNSKSFKELITMAANPINDEFLVYPTIQRPNEFIQYEKQYQKLEKYSSIQKVPIVRLYLEA